MNKLIIFSTLLLAAVSCSQVNEDDMIVAEETSTTVLEINASEYEEGYVRIRISEELVDEFEAVAVSGFITRTSTTSTNEILDGINVLQMTRTFPYAGRFEARTRANGLHLWYDVYFDESVSLTRANSELASIDGVLEVEYRPKVNRISSELIPADDYITRSSDERDSDAPVNDPRLSSQWHYNNTGSLNNSIMGCDINLYAAWQAGFYGSSDVIVCIVDGGVDYSHEDIADNMWINEAELYGTEGVDDDNNGYVDDIYGYDFVYSTSTITADSHGTHVGGTVSAVNNNGIGVAGIAGGNAALGIGGAKLMSAQIFCGDYSASSNNTANAIKYGADNGAVISQNSWGYSVNAAYIPNSDRIAIDYFVEYAGFDEYGNQVGPMAGGVVVFAAGNDSYEYSAPGQYDSCICVTSVAANYDAAYYTNYGTWADIAAPGGDAYDGRYILSTAPGNSYGYMQGTSMAAPHVSGVCAMLVSKFGGPGYTPDMLKSQLYDYGRDLDAEGRTSYISYSNLGPLVDVFASLTSGSSIPIVENTPDGLYFTSADTSYTIDLTEVFSGEDLEYSVASSNSAVATASVSGSIATIKSVANGNASITLTASNSSISVPTSFRAMVNIGDGNAILDKFTGTLTISATSEYFANITITNAADNVVYSGSAQMSPTAPAIIDISGFAAGSYKVVVTYDGGVIVNDFEI